MEHDTYGPRGYDPQSIREWVHSICENSGLTPTQLAKAARISPSTINRFLKPDWPGNLTVDTLEKLETAAISYIESRDDPFATEYAGFLRSTQIFREREGRKELDDSVNSLQSDSNQGVTYVPIYDQRVAAGDGFADHSESPTDQFAFTTSVLESITSSKYTSLVLVRVTGDSMWPTLHDGDQALVDQSIRSLGRDGIYVLRAGATDDIQVKRVQHEPRGTVSIISDNQNYRTYENVGYDDVAVVGRVVWIGRKV